MDYEIFDLRLRVKADDTAQEAVVKAPLKHRYDVPLGYRRMSCCLIDNLSLNGVVE